jgi:hypothetical protein
MSEELVKHLESLNIADLSCLEFESKHLDMLIEKEVAFIRRVRQETQKLKALITSERRPASFKDADYTKAAACLQQFINSVEDASFFERHRLE